MLSLMVHLEYQVAIHDSLKKNKCTVASLPACIDESCYACIILEQENVEPEKVLKVNFRFV